MAGHGVGVALGLVMLLTGDGRLRHEGTQAGVFGHLAEAGQLLVHHSELLA